MKLLIINFWKKIFCLQKKKMSGQSEFYADGDYQETALSGSLSTQRKLVQVQEMLEIISKMETADHVRKSLSNETDLEEDIKDLKNHASHLVKDMWIVEGQIDELTDSFSETKGIKRLDHILLEGCITLMYLHREFKRQNTQQESDILESQPSLIIEVQDKIEQLRKNTKIILDECHQINKEWEELIEERESILQENESPDGSCRVIGSGKLESC